MRKQKKQRGQPGGGAARPAVTRRANDRVPPVRHTCTAPHLHWQAVPGNAVRCKCPACTPALVPQAQAKQAGQSAVEFALVVTLAIIMFLGMMQFGMCLYGLSIVENAARNGARIGATSQGCTPCDVTAAAQSALQGQPVIRDAVVSVLAPGGVVGSTVRIRVTAHIPLVVPGGGTFGLGPLTTVSAVSTFRQEGWRP